MKGYRDMIQSDALPYVDALRLPDATIDDHGLILPNISGKLEAKIADNLNDAHHRISVHSAEDKHILYLPGAYDLVHVGHASYVQQAIDHYLENQPDLSREDLYVVLLADSDSLIEATKGAPGKGKGMRPLQASDIFSSLALDLEGVQPRLYDLASLDTDLVGLIPSPPDLGKLLRKGAFRDWFESYSGRHVNVSGLNEKDPTDSNILKGLNGYLEMVDRLKARHFSEVGFDFMKARRDSKYDPSSGKWNIESWQTFIHMFLGSASRSNPSIRVISEHDVNYKDVVAGLMQRVGIDHTMIDDVELVSTTSLIETFTEETLVGAKMDHYLSLRGSM